VPTGSGSGGGAGIKSSGLGRWSLFLRVAVAIAAMCWVFRDQDWGQLAQTFQKMDGTCLALSVVVFVLGQVLLATRWWLLLRVQGIPMKVGMAVKLHLLGLFYNNVMPSAVGGDLLRAWYASKHTDKRLIAALSVFVDRAVALVSMLLMVLVVYLCLVHGQMGQPAPHVTPMGNAQPIRPLLVLGIVGGVLLAALAGYCHPGIRRRVAQWGRVAWGHLAAAGRTFRDSMLLYWKKPLVLLAAAGLTILLQSLIIMAFWVLGRSLGIRASVRYYFIIFPATWLLSALPVSIAGLGLLEGGIRELFTRLAAVPAEQALALALCQRFVWVVASLPGGLIHLLGAHLPRVNSFDDQSATG